MVPIFHLLAFALEPRIGETVAGWLWVSEESRHEWHRVTGEPASLNIHLCTHTLWITEKLLTDSISFCSFLFLQPNQGCIYGYEHPSVLFLHVHTSKDAVKKTGLLPQTCGESEQEVLC